MTKVYFTDHALTDLERIFEFLTQTDPALSEATGHQIVNATGILQHHPLIGRPMQDNLRELVISTGRTGYVALYRFMPEEDYVDVLAVRHQRESGFVE